MGRQEEEALDMKSADWLGKMFERIDAKDLDGFVEYFAEDAQFRFGHIG